MAKCARCGAETELYELDVPTCPACIAEREGTHPSLETLRAEISSAREIYRQAMEKFEQHQAAGRDSSKAPDRTVAGQLEAKAKTAGERYWAALQAYSDALQKGTG